MATFITSKAVGESLSMQVTTSDGYWKYNHDGVDSNLFSSWAWSVSVTNPNGEFTIIPCDNNGNPSGDIIALTISSGGEVTSIDTTGLSALWSLNLNGQLLTTLDITNTPNLRNLNISQNQITSLDFSNLSYLYEINLGGLNLTSLDNFQLPTTLQWINLSFNQLQSFDGSELINVQTLYLVGLNLTSLDDFSLPINLSNLGLSQNPLLTSFDLSYLTSLNQLTMQGGIQINEKFTSFSSNDYILPSNLSILDLANNNLSSFDSSGLPTSITRLNLNTNPISSVNISSLINLNILDLAYWGDGVSQMTPSANDQILQQLNQHGVSNGYFGSNNGRTAASNTSYNNLLNNLTWSFYGLDLPIVGNGKLAIRGVNSGGGTPPSYQFPLFGSSLMFNQGQTTVTLEQELDKEGNLVNYTKLSLSVISANNLFSNTNYITSEPLMSEEAYAQAVNDYLDTISVDWPLATGIEIYMATFDNNSDALDVMNPESPNYLNYNVYGNQHGGIAAFGINDFGLAYNYGNISNITQPSGTVNDWLYRIVTVKVLGDGGFTVLGDLEPPKFIGSLV